jgi:hypothetical protein
MYFIQLEQIISLNSSSKVFAKEKNSFGLIDAQFK